MQYSSNTVYIMSTGGYHYEKRGIEEEIQK